MSGVTKILRRCRLRVPVILRDRKAATAVEYGLICALIVVAIIASIRGVATTTIDMWNDVGTKVDSATQSSANAPGPKSDAPS